MECIIEKLYEKNFESDISTSKEKLLEYIERHKNSLFEKLNKENRDTLIKLLECIEELYSIYCRNEFESGFKLGGKIVSEIHYK